MRWREHFAGAARHPWGFPWCRTCRDLLVEPSFCRGRGGARGEGVLDVQRELWPRGSADPRGEVARGQQAARLRMTERVGPVLGRRTRVEGDDHRAQAQEREHQHRDLQAVGREDGDTIASANAEVAVQRPCQLLDPGHQVAVRQAAVARPSSVEGEGRAAPPPRPSRDQTGNVEDRAAVHADIPLRISKPYS